MGRFSFAVLCAALTLPTLSAAAPKDVLHMPSLVSNQSIHAVLLDVKRAGNRLVAVGERGIVLLSDDDGKSWRQAAVPVSATLTAVTFANPRQGWAVGHGAVVLHSDDGGENWRLQLDGNRAAALELAAAETEKDDARIATAKRLKTDGADKPLLAVNFTDDRHGLVTGAYGLAMYTEDGGATWSSWIGRLPNPRALHIYTVAQMGTQIYLAGEQGLFLRSLDGGKHFDALHTPYEGSYFSLTVLPDGVVMVAGLRGKVLRSTDRGESFQTIENPLPISINEIHQNGTNLLLVNQAGGLLQVTHDSQQLTPITLPPGPPLNAVTQAADGTFVGVGFAGPMRLTSSINAAE
ncbi:YCF48-related protein [Pseudomonas sp. PB101]|uniref:WD40/YVTN/BNR-like repeat-containing protein n=1 Tax=Pseudomonas sp. PB101 TaxID=2495428 RepID=UPI002115A9F9|nr:YCF48-related protein [Pseudomonas sp. PB101]